MGLRRLAAGRARVHGPALRWRPAAGAGAAGRGEQKSRGLDVEQLSTSLGEIGQQVDDVEVAEQAVDERDDGVQHAGFTRSVSHRASVPDRSCLCEPASVGLELQSALEDVAGDVGGAAAGGVSVSAQPDKGLGQLNLQLGDEHSGGLADL